MELEGGRLLDVDTDAGDVAREQVWGELDATRGAFDTLGDCPGERGLAGAGKVLEQQVALAEQSGERQPDDKGLAQEYLVDVGHQSVEDVCEPAGLLGGHAHGVAFRAFVDGRPAKSLLVIITVHTIPGRSRGPGTAVRSRLVPWPSP